MIAAITQRLSVILVISSEARNLKALAVANLVSLPRF